MKLVIVEGTDRVGKDTLVNRLIEESKSSFKRHWSFPIGSNDKEKTEYQKKSFTTEFSLYCDISSDYSDLDILMIWNRSHLGEFVYGTLYRNSDPESWVWDLEKSYLFDEDPDIYLILLDTDPEFVVSKEDGNSYSSKLEDKKKEINLFRKVFEESRIINKLMIKVNENDSYVSKEEIYQKVKVFINE